MDEITANDNMSFNELQVAINKAMQQQNEMMYKLIEEIRAEQITLKKQIAELRTQKVKDSLLVLHKYIQELEQKYSE